MIHKILSAVSTSEHREAVWRKHCWSAVNKKHSSSNVTVTSVSDNSSYNERWYQKKRESGLQKHSSKDAAPELGNSYRQAHWTGSDDMGRGYIGLSLTLVPPYYI